MDLSPKTLREVEFREKMRGYHPEDVDQFLEEVAAGLEVLHDRLRQAVERAQRAESLAAESGTNDETLRRTLVLAQRTADLAVQEAREQAARILAGAEQQAQAMLGEAEERARRGQEEAMAEVRAEVARIEALRHHAESEVQVIRRWVDDHRTTLTSALKDALAMLEGAKMSSPPPPLPPLDLPPAGRAGTGTPAASAPVAPAASPPGAPAAAPPAEMDPHAGGPPTMAWSSAEDTDEGRADPYLPPPHRATAEPSRSDSPSESPGEAPPPASHAAPDQADGPDEQALDDFFDDDQFADDDRGFGGRLRRRR